jgi:hypothetical protein
MTASGNTVLSFTFRGYVWRYIHIGISTGFSKLGLHIKRPLGNLSNESSLNMKPVHDSHHDTNTTESITNAHCTWACNLAGQIRKEACSCAENRAVTGLCWLKRAGAFPAIGP